MKLEQWVLFIDMLGYRELNGQISDDKSANDFLNFMKNNEKIFLRQNNDDIKKMYSEGIFDLYLFYEIQVVFISDSLIINYKPLEFFDKKIDEKIRNLHSANALFIIIDRIQEFIYHCLKEKNILIRGGVSNKYCSVQNNFAVGEGLIEAYINESKMAVYPRIVLSSSIIDNLPLIESFKFLSWVIYHTDTFLKEDGDGVFYIDYLKYVIKSTQTNMAENDGALVRVGNILVAHKLVIESKLNDLKNKINNEADSGKLKELDKIQAKIIWLKNYYNENVIDAPPHFKIS
ncbi:hypothetical protein [Fibrella forsythiae]|uniref:Uncharacterized protein n=1 Tax=Fibrella forsythiae TaxID=2817061 RepID=A0ABS3JDI0_9BACT|nr:hypothetical protein [Fibrella forsythiae]MBO0947506.1 hypothetical protein [Fibrella forsythiae]